MKEYDHTKIEKKWQKEWDTTEVYKTDSATTKKKFYVLDMFPYPSGAGLHVGHPRGYIGSDVYARMKRMAGYNVLHPMGYDAFGLPAEQYAIEHKIHPSSAVAINVATFEKQLSMIGLSYDWSRKVNTTDPAYYKWTQWIFLEIYNSWYDKSASVNKARPISELIEIFIKNGNANIDAVCDINFNIVFTASEWVAYTEVEKESILMKYRLAYEGYALVNWCPNLGTVLANDEIVDDKDGNPVSERGGHPVEKVQMRQWFMRITAYSDRLIDGLENIEWSTHIKEIQRNWIGKSEGSEISFNIRVVKKFSSGSRMREDEEPDHEENIFDNSTSIKVFTTRADTIFGATYMVLAPEHTLVEELSDRIDNLPEVKAYILSLKNKSEADRTKNDKEKTGVELKGITAINPANNEEIPVWIADYVLVGYGTGAIMAVPEHDERDREFATKFNLPIVDKPLVDAKEITEKVGGKIVTKYKMRDAIFARQRYWGEPIPLKHNTDGTITVLEEKDLPLELPNVDSYEPIGTGESPLGSVPSWVKEGYETNTMPGWAGSSWYFLRYMDPNNNDAFASKEALEYWKDVDMYVGGQEHATGHLLYSRFWHKFLYDRGYVPTDEPFKVLRNQGLIIASDGRKMSKRWGNVVNPDEIVKTYGADTLRVYEMFMGPFDQAVAWNTQSIIGSRRFLEKVWKGAYYALETGTQKTPEALEKELHKTIKKVSEDIETMSFNTAISSMMMLSNQIEKYKIISISDYKLYLQILAPFAPHIAEELWNLLNGDENGPSIHTSGWPIFDEKKIIDDTIIVVVQVNGKVRTQLSVESTISEEQIKELALKDKVVLGWIDGKEVKKIIYVKGRLVSIVV